MAKSDTQRAGAAPAAGRARSGGRRAYSVGKRGLDLLLSVLILALAAPLWVLIALAIKVDSPGPVLFRQRRIGQGGREFVMYKFRSMVSDADPRVHWEAFRRFAEGEPLEVDGAGPRYKAHRDPRVTRVGRLLRATNLDEVPQLLNVLRGEMSLVGPRPAIPYELEWYKDWYFQRFQVAPGISGLWQVKSRNRVGLEEMVRQDLEYIRRRSLLLDLQIIALTVPGMLLHPRGNGGKPAREEP